MFVGIRVREDGEIRQVLILLRDMLEDRTLLLTPTVSAAVRDDRHRAERVTYASKIQNHKLHVDSADAANHFTIVFDIRVL